MGGWSGADQRDSGGDESGCGEEVLLVGVEK